MKKILSVLFCILILFCAIGCTDSSEDTVQGDANPVSDFEYHEDTGYTVIDKYVGTDKTVVIPDKIRGMTVIALMKESFKGTSVTSVNIPDTVVIIHRNAFQECAELREVNIGKSVTYIGEGAFEDCTSLRKLILPEKVASLGSRIAVNCTALTEVFIPKTLKDWQSGAFYNCTALTKITFEDGLEVIGDQAFGNAAALETVTIPASVKTIRDNAFDKCDSLKKVYFEGDKPEDLASDAFNSYKANITVYYKEGTKGWDEGKLRIGCDYTLEKY